MMLSFSPPIFSSCFCLCSVVVFSVPAFVVYAKESHCHTETHISRHTYKLQRHMDMHMLILCISELMATETPTELSVSRANLLGGSWIWQSSFSTANIIETNEYISFTPPLSHLLLYTLPPSLPLLSFVLCLNLSLSCVFYFIFLLAFLFLFLSTLSRPFGHPLSSCTDGFSDSSES